MKIAVTGARGFIGGHVTAFFAGRGDTVLPIARPFVRETLAHALQGVGVVVHLAGVITAARDRDYVTGNVDATRVVAEAARDAGARLVHISSLAAAGPAPADAPRREEDPPSPVTAYGRSKLESERAIREIAGLRWTVLRPGIVYGSGDRALVPLFRLARSRMMPLVGPGTAAYTFVHVDDVVRAIAAAVDRTSDGNIVFVGHPHPVGAREMLERVRAAAGGRAPIVRIPNPILWVAAVAGDISSVVLGKPALITTRRFVELTAPGFVCRVDRLRDDLGVEPAVGLTDGLRESTPWYLSQI